MSQSNGEQAAGFVTRVIMKTRNAGLPESMIAGIAIRGLKATLRDKVMPQTLKTIEEATKVQNDVRVSQLEFHLVHHAEAFYYFQPTDVRDDYALITQAMKDRFHGKSDLTNLDIMAMQQSNG